MTEYKLTYYDITGLAEPIRFIFAIAGVPYEDNRIPKNETTHPKLPPEIKAELPWGNIPVLEYDGKKLAQTNAITRFLARKFNLAGSDDFESAKCDEIVDAFKDFGMEWRQLVVEQDPIKKNELKAQLIEVTVPKYMNKFSSIVEANGGQWFVGSTVTWTDIVFVHFMTLIITKSGISLVENYPVLKKLMESFNAIPQVKEWIEKRPKTE